MKVLFLVLFALAAAGLQAQDATIVYLAGDVDVRTEGGASFAADFGDELDSGDRVITRRTGEAELELTTGGTVNVGRDTVFIIGSTTGPTGEPTSRVAAAVGSFSFRFSAAVGNEPRIGSTTSVAGVRGTEVRVYVGSDGTTRYEVLEGLVEIEDAARSVTLGPEQAIEITPGAGVGPANVFAFLEQPIDYGVWNAGLVEGFLADPLPSLRGIAAEMQDLLDEIRRRAPEVEALLALSAQESGRLDEIEKADGLEARQEYFRDTVMPARRAARAAFVDFRFVVLSALSLDQHIFSRLAAEMEAWAFFDPDTGLIDEFRSELAAIRSQYEAVVVPWLVPSDLPWRF